MSLKQKPDKTKFLSKCETLDGKHKEKISEFTKRKENLPVLKEKLIELANKKNTTNSSNELYDINNDIDNLKEEINDIENNISELNYYSQTIDILFKYYDNNTLNGNEVADEIPAINSTPFTPFNTLNEISKNTQQQKKIKRISQHRNPQNINNSMSIFDFFNSINKNQDPTIIINKICDEKQSKSQLYDEYMNVIDTKYNSTKKPNYINYNKICEKCKTQQLLVQNEGFYVCPTCGTAENIIIESEIPNYKEPIQEKQCFVYKRKNHLNEWLNQFQAKETTIIPNDVYERIIKEINKLRIRDLSKIDFNMMKNILKHLKLQQYYEHNIYILCKITGTTPPTITRETEQKIRRMFEEVQRPFNKYKPKNRTNFLSYSYVLHKFFQILHLNDVLAYLPLLKSREKLRLQDKIWKNICNDLGWDFYESI